MSDLFHLIEILCTKEYFFYFYFKIGIEVKGRISFHFFTLNAAFNFNIELSRIRTYIRDLEDPCPIP